MACILYQSRRDMANDTLVKLNCLVLSVSMPECLIKMRGTREKASGIKFAEKSTADIVNQELVRDLQLSA